ncbi:hypothetical protein LDENG_00245190 [Lucifuga dentata]|nr:hypothetical protein LDENG_00245190 [Lucifuga dentata]
MQNTVLNTRGQYTVTFLCQEVTRNTTHRKRDRERERSLTSAGYEYISDIKIHYLGFRFFQNDKYLKSHCPLYSIFNTVLSQKCIF